MKPCPECGKKYKNDGLQIHLVKVHGIHPQHDTDSEYNVLVSESKICPVPGCEIEVDDLQSHLESEHEDWRLSSGKWVFDV